MRSGAPSDPTVLDSTFLVGNELVEFDRGELPIYAAPRSRWMEAAHDDSPGYGAPVDRLFGDADDLHIDGAPHAEAGSAVDALVAAADPLVALPALADGLDVLAPDATAPELATSFDLGADSPAVVIASDVAGWDSIAGDGTFDYLA